MTDMSNRLPASIIRPSVVHQQVEGTDPGSAVYSEKIMLLNWKIFIDDVKIRCDAHHDKLSSFIKSNIYMALATLYLLYTQSHTQTFKADTVSITTKVIPKKCLF